MGKHVDAAGRHEHGRTHYGKCRCRCDVCRAAQAKYMRGYTNSTKARRQKGIDRARAWNVSHPERAAASERRRDAKRRGAEGAHSLRDWERLLNRWDHRCAWGVLFDTCEAERRDDLTVGHVMPLSRDGTNYIGNILPLCRYCNGRQASSTVMAFRLRMGV